MSPNFDKTIPLRALYLKSFFPERLLEYPAICTSTRILTNFFIFFFRFPVFILILIPIRTILLPKYFTAEELSILDAPTASPFTLESAGVSYSDYPESIDISPEDTGTVDMEAFSDSDELESEMERGDAMRLSRRRSSAVRHGDDTEDGDAIE